MASNENNHNTDLLKLDFEKAFEALEVEESTSEEITRVCEEVSYYFHITQPTSGF